MTSSQQPNIRSKNNQNIKDPTPHLMRTSHGISKKSKNREGINLFTSERTNIDYVTLGGVCKRTGANEDELAVFLLKELVDNGVDFIEVNMPPSHDRPSEIYVEIKYHPLKNHVVIKVRNNNFGLRDVCFTEERISAFFRDMDVFHSSKRNLFKLSRGLQGDALKEVVCIPYALASRYYGSIHAWNEPFIIRNGFGQEFAIRIVVDKIQKRNYFCISKTSRTRLKYDIFTEVEIHLPYDDRIIDLHQLKIVLIEHALLNTHISFRFNLMTSTTKEEYYRVTLPATQKLSIGKTNSKRLTSIYYYDLDTFENLIYSIENKNLIVYDILRHHFREGISLKREDDLLIPISELTNPATSSKQESKKKIRDIFQRLRHVMGPTTIVDSSKVKKDLLPFNIKDKQRALIQRVNRLGYTLNKKLKYRTKVGYYADKGNYSDISKSTTAICFPYFVEAAVINTHNMPYNLLYCEGINASPKHYYSFLDGYDLMWTTKSGTKKEAYSLMSLLQEYGYSHRDGKPARQRSIIMLNLWCPKIEYTDYGKSSINLLPFVDTVVNLLYKICSDGNGLDDSEDGNKLEAKTMFKEYLIEERYKKVLADSELRNTDRWNTSTPVYRIRPILESRGLGNISRKYLQSLVKVICDEKHELKLVNGNYVETGRIGVEREVMGIYEATRAYIYFRGRIYDVSLDRLAEIKKIAAYVLIIEKEGVAELLTHYADMNGIALCYTKGFLTDNAKKLCELAPKAGARVAVLTDDDFSGWVMAGKVPNIPRIGINLDTLKRLQIPLDEVIEDLPKPKGSTGKLDVDYHANKHATTAKEMYNQELIPHNDWELVTGGKYGRRIEIDNVLAYVGAERFWNEFVLPSFKQLFKTANYNLSLSKLEYVELPALRRLNELSQKKCKVLAEERVEKIESKYKKFEGFIPDIAEEEKKIEIQIEHMELENKGIQELESAIKQLIQKFSKRFGMTSTKT
jgi:hypothetical protein